MKLTSFPRRFDKTDLNFQKVYTHSQSSGHIRIQSELTHVRIALSFIFQHSKKPAKYKNDSQTTKSRLISQNFSLDLFCHLANARTAKNIEAVASVASMDQNLPIEQTHHFPSPFLTPFGVSILGAFGVSVSTLATCPLKLFLPLPAC